MQGERFIPDLEPLGTDLRNAEVTNTFGIAADPHSDEVHSVLALASIMNAFPQAVARNGVPLPIKCDIIKLRSSIKPESVRLGLAYATRRDQCYWILFSEDFIKSCASNAKIFARSIKALEPSLFRGVKEEHLLALVRDMTMEIIVQHELCHVKQGHVDYASQYGPRGIVEPSFSDRFMGNLKVNQRPMEFIADEAGIGSATLRSGIGNWMLVDRSAKEHFDTSTLSLAAYIGMLAFTIEASGIDSNDGYPSKAARTLHFHNIFCGYVHQAVTTPELQFRVNPGDLVEKAHLCLDVINEAANRGLLKDRDARGLLKDRDASFKAAVASLFSDEARAKAQRECDEIARECREEIPKWAPFHGQYVSWQDYVAYERQNGRNPIGVGG
jgi:hypothetical protein